MLPLEAETTKIRQRLLLDGLMTTMQQPKRMSTLRNIVQLIMLADILPAEKVSHIFLITVLVQYLSLDILFWFRKILRAIWSSLQHKQALFKQLEDSFREKIGEERKWGFDAYFRSQDRWSDDA